jgi:hypothetical protein
MIVDGLAAAYAAADSGIWDEFLISRKGRTDESRGSM